MPSDWPQIAALWGCYNRIKTLGDCGRDHEEAQGHGHSLDHGEVGKAELAVLRVMRVQLQAKASARNPRGVDTELVRAVFDRLRSILNTKQLPFNVQDQELILNTGAPAQTPPKQHVQHVQDQELVASLCRSMVFETIYLWMPSESDRCARLKELAVQSSSRDSFDEVVFHALCRRVQDDEEAALHVAGSSTDAHCLMEVFEVFLGVAFKDAVALVGVGAGAGAPSPGKPTEGGESPTTRTLEVLQRNLLSWILSNARQGGSGSSPQPSDSPVRRITAILTTHIARAADELVDRLHAGYTPPEITGALRRLGATALRSVPLNFIVCSHELLRVVPDTTCIHECLACLTQFAQRLAALASLPQSNRTRMGVFLGCRWPHHTHAERRTGACVRACGGANETT